MDGFLCWFDENWTRWIKPGYVYPDIADALETIFADSFWRRKTKAQCWRRRRLSRFGRGRSRVPAGEWHPLKIKMKQIFKQYSTSLGSSSSCELPHRSAKMLTVVKRCLINRSIRSERLKNNKQALTTLTAPRTTRRHASPTCAASSNAADRGDRQSIKMELIPGSGVITWHFRLFHYGIKFHRSTPSTARHPTVHHSGGKPFWSYLIPVNLPQPRLALSSWLTAMVARETPDPSTRMTMIYLHRAVAQQSTAHRLRLALWKMDYYYYFYYIKSK